MKKLALLLLLTLLLTSVMTACQKDDGEAPYGMKLASDPDATDYTLYVPEEWEVTMANGATMAQASLSDSTSVIVTNHTNASFVPRSDSKENLRYYYEGDDNFEGYADKLKGLFDKTTDENGEEVSTFTLVEEPSYITLKKGDSHVAAMKVVYTAKLDGAEVEQVVVIAYENDSFYNLTFTTLPAVYADNQTTFETILENFNFD